MNKVFFTSDEHYGHENIIKHCKRPFKDAGEMTRELVARHNSKVGKGDITFHLGDIFWRTVSVPDAYQILSALNGQHFLIYGNHDETAREMDAGFIWKKDLFMFKRKDGLQIALCHYPMRTWRNKERGSLHLFGHVHGAYDFLPRNGSSFDIGVDSHDFFPLSLEEVSEKLVVNNQVIVPSVDQSDCDSGDCHRSTVGYLRRTASGV